MLTTRITKLLGIRYPIIQAGMAGTVTTPELVAAVSEAGGLGTLGAGYMTADAIRMAIASIRKKTSKPFAVNLLITRRVKADEQTVQKGKAILRPIEQQLGIEEHDVVLPVEDYHEKIAVLIEEKVPVFSFAFDIPDIKEIKELKRNGTIIIGTATNIREGKVLANIGVDIIVGQGSEAGGHRGTFLGSAQNSLIGTMALIPQLVDTFPHIPIVAAGGIMDGRGLAASITLGADGIQMGTAFLTCKESGAHEVHKQAVLHSHERSTVVTNVFSGRYARGIENDFIQQLRDAEQDIPPYPIQNALTGTIRKEGAKQKDENYMALWAGQASILSRETTASSLIERTIEEARNVINRLQR